MSYKLEFELVPEGCWHSNLRYFLTREQWDALRKKVYARAGGKCGICGAPCQRLEAHERWEYNAQKGIQRLKDIIAVCPDCHAVIHIGRTFLKGDERAASEHFMRVNGCNYAEYRAALGRANEEHRRLNKVKEWRLDITKLSEFIK